MDFESNGVRQGGGVVGRNFNADTETVHCSDFPDLPVKNAERI